MDFFFNRDGISGQDGMTELVDKTALPNSIFKFNSSFLTTSYVKSKALMYSNIYD